MNGEYRNEIIYNNELIDSDYYYINNNQNIDDNNGFNMGDVNDSNMEDANDTNVEDASDNANANDEIEFRQDIINKNELCDAYNIDELIAEFTMFEIN